MSRLAEIGLSDKAEMRVPGGTTLKEIICHDLTAACVREPEEGLCERMYSTLQELQCPLPSRRDREEDEATVSGDG